MRYIEKNDPPQALLFWKAQRNAAAQSLDFAELGRVEMNGEMVDVKNAIKSQRLKDQGFLCAYTMIRITADTSHIEHLIPQSLSRIEKHREQTVEYGNMVVCYPGKESKGGAEFGAAYRGDQLLAVTPRDSKCEILINYHQNGTVTSQEPAVERMLNEDILNLNAATLKDRRKDTFDQHGVGLRSDKPLKIREAERFVNSVMIQNAKGEFPPFCIALAHAALEHIELLKKRRERVKLYRPPLSDR
ncbi:MAG: hypothetical protein ACOYOE_08450 [Chlorobium sp.]